MLDERSRWFLSQFLGPKVTVVDCYVTFDRDYLAVRCKSTVKWTSTKVSQIRERLKGVSLAQFSFWDLDWPTSRFEELRLRDGKVFLFFRFLKEEEQSTAQVIQFPGR